MYLRLFIGRQVGLAAVLLLGAGLFVRSLDNLRRVELGLQRDHVITFLARPAVPYDIARKVQAYRMLLEGLATVPGVRAVGANRTPRGLPGEVRRIDPNIVVTDLRTSRSPNASGRYVQSQLFGLDADDPLVFGAAAGILLLAAALATLLPARRASRIEVVSALRCALRCAASS